MCVLSNLVCICIIFVYTSFKIIQFNIIERFRYIHERTMHSCYQMIFTNREFFYQSVEHNIRWSRTLANSLSAMLSGIPVRLASKSTVSLAASQSDRSTMQLYSMLLFALLALVLAKFKSRKFFSFCIATLACCN